MIDVGAILIFFYGCCSLTREEVLELVPPAANARPESTHYLKLFSTCFCTCSCGAVCTHSVIWVCRESFSTSLVFNWMEATMLNPLGIVSLRTLNYRVLNW